MNCDKTYIDFIIDCYERRSEKSNFVQLQVHPVEETEFKIWYEWQSMQIWPFHGFFLSVWENYHYVECSFCHVIVSLRCILNLLWMFITHIGIIRYNPCFSINRNRLNHSMKDKLSIMLQCVNKSGEWTMMFEAITRLELNENNIAVDNL